MRLNEERCRDKACLVRAFLGHWALASLTTNLSPLNFKFRNNRNLKFISRPWWWW